MALQIQVPEPWLEHHNIFISVLVYLSLGGAWHCAMFFLAPLDGPPHPSVISVIVVIEETILISEVGTVVFPKVVHFSDTFWKKFILTRDQRHINSFSGTVLVLVNVHFHLHVRVPVVVKIFVQHLRENMEVRIFKRVLWGESNVVGCFYDRILMPLEASGELRDSKHEDC